MNVFYLGMKLQTDEGVMVTTKELISELDLSVEEGLKVLASADMRIVEEEYGPGHQIQYKNEWWDLGRTDLTNDVATGCCFHSHVDMSNLDEVRNYFAEKIRYGVRLCEEPKLFSCVDSWSDG